MQANHTEQDNIKVVLQISREPYSVCLGPAKGMAER